MTDGPTIGPDPVARAQQIDGWNAEIAVLDARLRELCDLRDTAVLQIQLEAWEDHQWEETRSALAAHYEQPPDAADPAELAEHGWVYEHDWIDDIPIPQFREFMIAHVRGYELPALRAVYLAREVTP